jgi:hypothetical protein
VSPDPLRIFRRREKPLYLLKFESWSLKPVGQLLYLRKAQTRKKNTSIRKATEIHIFMQKTATEIAVGI